MTDVVIVGLLSLGGTLIGTFGGIIASNRLTAWRIEQLEKKVDKHNSLIERTFKLEGKMCEVEHDIEDMKKQRGA
jgi:hypothetical protein